MRLGNDALALALPATLAAVLLLANLGDRLLWQDEAQTALIARTILSHGIPLGSDGTNYFSQELGREYAQNHVWKWHAWLPFYAVSASFLVFGTNTFAARLPFALFGIATVILTYATARTLWRDRRAAAAAAAMLAVCVPFLILSRQCRWYAFATFFSLLGLYAYAGLRRGAHRRAWLLFGALTLLFHSHYLYAATLLATLLLHAGIFEREKLRSVLVVAAATALFNLPWVWWFATIRYAESYGDRLLDLDASARYARRFTRTLFSDFFHPSLLLIPPTLAIWRRLTKSDDVEPGIWRGVWLILLFCVVNVTTLALVSPGAYVRYLAPLAPPLFLISGLLMGALLRRSLLAGAAALVVWVAWASGGPLQAYLHEITHGYEGPIEGIVRFLKQRARPSDTVAITYGDLPVKFYTPLRVIGGLTGEDLSEAQGAEWIILRRHRYTDEEKRVGEVLEAYLSAEAYERYVLENPDVAWSNREDIRLHHFATPHDRPPVVIYGRRR
ncbi:MAG: glycosyltransferase family 39 protein [Myxococcales bacterium]|nr:glycosyltransferase family 39 protein [Myxococcales bacterium]